jgi:hypothetical protein
MWRDPGAPLRADWTAADAGTQSRVPSAAERSQVMIALERDSIERGVPAELQALSALWWRLDNATSVAFLCDPVRLRGCTAPWEAGEAEIAFRVQACERLMTWLTRRTSARVAAMRRGLARAEIEEVVRRVSPGFANPGMLGYVGLVVRQTLEDKLGNDDRALARAAGHFAAGAFALSRTVALRSCWTNAAVSTGAPNSCAICLFSELALAMLELESASTFWVRTLRAFVSMLPSFRAAFGNGSPLSATELNRRCAQPPRRGVPEAQMLEAFDRLPVSTTDLAERFGQELLHTLSGEFVPP